MNNRPHGQAMDKRLISFSLFGAGTLYLEGALPNVELGREIYPGWTCRFYVSQEVPEQLVRRLQEEGAEVVSMRRRDRWDGLFWRFLAVDDPSAELVIVRDVDARLNRRERHAVDEWMASGKGFHIMRDHPLHNGEILAGMWGCRRGVLPDIRRMITSWGQFDHYKSDQMFLAVEVYPLVKDGALVHSDLFALEGETVAPFPTRRQEYEWVGAPLVPPGDVPMPLSTQWRPLVDGGELRVKPWNPNRLRFWRVRHWIPRPLRPVGDAVYARLADIWNQHVGPVLRHDMGTADGPSSSARRL
jgi:hypothetical protein